MKEQNKVKKQKNTDNYVKTKTEKAITAILVVLVVFAIIIQVIVSMDLVNFDPYIDFVHKIFGNTFS